MEERLRVHVSSGGKAERGSSEREEAWPLRAEGKCTGGKTGTSAAGGAVTDAACSTPDPPSRPFLWAMAEERLAHAGWAQAAARP